MAVYVCTPQAGTKTMLTKSNKILAAFLIGAIFQGTSYDAAAQLSAAELPAAELPAAGLPAVSWTFTPVSGDCSADPNNLQSSPKMTFLTEAAEGVTNFQASCGVAGLTYWPIRAVKAQAAGTARRDAFFYPGGVLGGYGMGLNSSSYNYWSAEKSRGESNMSELVTLEINYYGTLTISGELVACGIRRTDRDQPDMEAWAYFNFTEDGQPPKVFHSLLKDASHFGPVPSCYVVPFTERIPVAPGDYSMFFSGKSRVSTASSAAEIQENLVSSSSLNVGINLFSIEWKTPPCGFADLCPGGEEGLDAS